MNEWVVILGVGLIISEHLKLDIINALESGDHLEYQSKGVFKALIVAPELNLYFKFFLRKKQHSHLHSVN